MLRGWLRWQRATLLWKCQGLSLEQLRARSAPPSPLCLLGLLRHMAEVERSWFRRTLQGEEVGLIYSSSGDFEAAFRVPEGESWGEALGTWQEECRLADLAEEAAPSLEQTGWRASAQEWVSLRWILIHMIEEYARHNGHADLLRERIDGRTGA